MGLGGLGHLAAALCLKNRLYDFAQKRRCCFRGAKATPRMRALAWRNGAKIGGAQACSGIKRGENRNRRPDVAASSYNARAGACSSLSSSLGGDALIYFYCSRTTWQAALA